jgi:hypothetical protein
VGVSVWWAYLANAFALFVALIAFKRAKSLLQDANLLAFTLKDQKSYLDLGKLYDELADLTNAVQANRDLIAKIQGRQGGRPPKAVVPEGPAEIKARLRAQVRLNGAQPGGTN